MPGIDALWRSRNASNCWRAFSRIPTASSRARHKLRIASCASSGTQIVLSSPARDSSANRTQSRRSFLTRSPGRRGINDGATISQQVAVATQLTVQAIAYRAGFVDHVHLRRIAGLGQHLEQRSARPGRSVPTNREGSPSLPHIPRSQVLSLWASRPTKNLIRSSMARLLFAAAGPPSRMWLGTPRCATHDFGDGPSPLQRATMMSNVGSNPMVTDRGAGRAWVDAVDHESRLRCSSPSPTGCGHREQRSDRRLPVRGLLTATPNYTVMTMTLRSGRMTNPAAAIAP